jgi:hypothetical protein
MDLTRIVASSNSGDVYWGHRLDSMLYNCPFIGSSVSSQFHFWFSVICFIRLHFPIHWCGLWAVGVTKIWHTCPFICFSVGAVSILGMDMWDGYVRYTKVLISFLHFSQVYLFFHVHPSVYHMQFRRIRTRRHSKVFSTPYIYTGVVYNGRQYEDSSKHNVILVLSSFVLVLFFCMSFFFIFTHQCSVSHAV